MKLLFFLLLGCAPFLPLTAAVPVPSSPPAKPVADAAVTQPEILPTPPPVAAVVQNVTIVEPPASNTTEPEETPKPVRPKDEPLPAAKEADFERLANGDIRIGLVTLHRQARKLSFPGKIAHDATQSSTLELGGVLEVLIATDKGRLYESLLSSEAKPSHLQVMLILLGLNNGTRVPNAQGRQGDQVDIDVEWQREDGTLIEEPVENFLFDARTKKHTVPVGWTFVGTTVQGGVVNADIEGNIALAWSVGSTILDTADPDGEKSGIFMLNPEHVKPQAGTPVRIILTPRAKPAKDTKKHP